MKEETDTRPCLRPSTFVILSCLVLNVNENTNRNSYITNSIVNIIKALFVSEILTIIKKQNTGSVDCC